MQIELADLVKIYNRMEVLEAKNAEYATRIAKLEESVAKLKDKAQAPLSRPPFPTQSVKGKYKKLAEYLYKKWARTMELSYKQIEDILGFSLPPTAENIPQSYWANTKTHSYAKGSWLAVGYKAKVIGDKRVQFERDLY